ncbi:hypothetical protein M5689_001813 [Euphorbia peplus]|nr:hypothetical protein M5689_001813 [Euphorbia peplus]
MADSSKLKLKLLIDKKNMTVLFAEANKEFVDFLFSLMSLPLGTVVKLLKSDAPMPGSLGDLFRSIESIDHTYIQSRENIKSILDPKPAATAFKSPVLLSDCQSVNRKAYMCLDKNAYPGYAYSALYHPFMSDVPNTACPCCKKPMNYALNSVDSYNSANQGVAGGGGGFVKGVVTYMVMDNLEVKPLSTISSIVLINSLNIRDLSCLEEMVVPVGLIQALKLLRASLESKNVLTSVFLDNN